MKFDLQPPNYILYSNKFNLISLRNPLYYKSFYEYDCILLNTRHFHFLLYLPLFKNYLYSLNYQHVMRLFQDLTCIQKTKFMHWRRMIIELVYYYYQKWNIYRFHDGSGFSFRILDNFDLEIYSVTWSRFHRALQCCYALLWKPWVSSRISNYQGMFSRAPFLQRTSIFGFEYWMKNIFLYLHYSNHNLQSQLRINHQFQNANGDPKEAEKGVVDLHILTKWC